MKRINGKPIWDSYADVADMSRPCPNCGAVNTWCTKPDGRVRRVPCVSRLTTNHTTIEENTQA
ncbi:hypothetical protein [Mycolicibacterium poriferae]|uniref:hypothetical protein n=1 Tax=Mycolicibacterium poriferae TaxID=39694 RepID=UPI0024B93E4C|nr:hypothetical protein [Mycolicibacterium poriferae]